MRGRILLGLQGLAYAVHGTDGRLRRSAVAETGLVRKRGILLLFARRSDRLVGMMTFLCVTRNRRCRFLGFLDFCYPRHSVGQALALRLKGFVGNGGALSTVHTSGVALLGGDTALA